MTLLSQQARDLIAQEMMTSYSEVQRLKEARAENDRALTAAKERLRQLHEALLGEGRELEISEHAVLRYAERVLGLDQDEVRAKIVACVAPFVRALGDGKYPVGNGCVAVVHNGAVVSVVPA